MLGKVEFSGFFSLNTNQFLLQVGHLVLQVFDFVVVFGERGKNLLNFFLHCVPFAFNISQRLFMTCLVLGEFLKF